MTDVTNDLTPDEIFMLNEVKKVKGFEDIEPTEAGLAVMDERFQELEEQFNTIDDNLLSRIKVTTKVSDLNQEVTVTVKADDNEAFQVLQKFTPLVELFPLLAQAELACEAERKAAAEKFTGKEFI